MDEALKKQQETNDDARFNAKRMVDFAQRDPRSLMAPDVSCTGCELCAHLTTWWHLRKINTKSITLSCVHCIVQSIFAFSIKIKFNSYGSTTFRSKGPSIKDVRSQGREGGLSSANIFRIRGGRLFRCGRPHVFAQKTSDFLNLWCIRADKGEGDQFSQFCADVFYGRPLTVPCTGSFVALINILCLLLGNRIY